MQLTIDRVAQIICVALIISVVTQVMYIGLDASGTPLATAIWRTEAVVMLLIGMFGFKYARHWPLVSAGLVAGGLFNVMQTGMGLTMFGPLGDAGEPLAPVMGAVLSYAFFLYFAAKAAFGLGAVALGLKAWSKASGWPKLAGVLAGLTGLIALVLNLYAMCVGMAAVFLAGAAGTVAAFFLALAIGALRPADTEG